MKGVEWYSIAIASLASVVISLLVHFFLFFVIFPSNKGSRSKFYGRLYWTSYNKEYPEYTPQNKLLEMVEIWGSPSSIDRSKGGNALWKPVDMRASQFVRAEIVDEMLFYNVPYPHYNFMTVWYPFSVSEDKASRLRKISEEITYDPLKEEVLVRSDDLRSIVVTFWIIKKYVNGEYTLDRAQSELGPRIKALQNHPINSKEYDTYYRDL